MQSNRPRVFELLSKARTRSVSTTLQPDSVSIDRGKAFPEGLRPQVLDISSLGSLEREVRPIQPALQNEVAHHLFCTAFNLHVSLCYTMALAMPPGYSSARLRSVGSSVTKQSNGGRRDPRAGNNRDESCLRPETICQLPNIL